jgi:iron-regulated transporter 1
MRRIDLMCKLLGPLFIATIDAFDTKVAIILNFAMNAASVVVEYYAIARVYHQVPDLQQPKSNLQIATEDAESSEALSKPWFVRAREHISKSAKKSAADFGLYFRHRLFLPSISGALLYLTVLSFSGQMVTYLLSAGYTSLQVGVARTLSVAFEMLATWIAPWLIGHIGAVRAGLWFISYQVTMLVAGFAVFWAKEDSPVLSASGLVGGTILSRVGLWGFDLCVQLIIQEVNIRLGDLGCLYSSSAQELMTVIRMSNLRTVVHSPLISRGF